MRTGQKEIMNKTGLTDDLVKVGPCVHTVTRHWGARRYSPQGLDAQQSRTCIASRSREGLQSDTTTRRKRLPAEKRGPTLTRLAVSARKRFCRRSPDSEKGSRYRHIVPTKSTSKASSGVSGMTLSTNHCALRADEKYRTAYEA